MKYSWFLASPPFDVLSNRNLVKLIFRRLIICLIFAGIVCSVGISYGNNQNTPLTKQNIYAESLTHELSALFTRYRRAAPAEKKQLLNDLVALAAERQKLLAQIMEENPGEVLRLKLPERLRSAMPGVVKEHLEKHMEQQGTLQVIVEDNEHNSRLRHFLKAEGEHLSLHFQDQPPKVTSGGQVRVRGVQIDDAMAVEHGNLGLQFLAPDGNEGTATTGGVIGEVVKPIGEQRTLVLLVNFQDTANETPFMLPQAYNAVFGTVSDFFYEASYGQTWLTGDVHGWYTLPIDSTCNTIDITNAADAAATEDGVNLSGYGRFIYVMKGAAQCFWSGASNMWVYPSRAWLNGNLNPMVIAHELGHGFGLYHSNFSDCGATVLGSDCVTATDDKFDAMGSSPEPGHFNAFQKERLGWLLPGDIITATVDGSYDLQPVELNDGVHPKAIKILKQQDPAGQGATWYYLEFRQALGFDEFIVGNENVLNGVLVHTGADFDSSTSLLLDMTPDSSIHSFYDRSDPALIAGASFSDPASGITISTDLAGAAGARISIGFGKPACVRGNPVVALSPPESQWVAAGTPIAYNVTVTSTDSDTCADATFDLSLALPAGDWATAFENDVLSVAPGSSGSTVLTVTSATTASDGFHDIVVMAENSTEAIYASSATATYVVNAGTVNQAPIPMDDETTIPVDSVVTVNVLANDVDPDGDPLSVSRVTQGAKGTVSINVDYSVTYTPESRFKGTDSFTYTVTDGFDFSDAVVTVKVNKNGGSKGGAGIGKGKGKNH